MSDLVKIEAPKAYEDIAGTLQFAKEMAQSTGAMMGKAISREQGQALALHMLCTGMTPVELARNFHLIDGKLVMRADAMLANFRSQFGGKYSILSRTPEEASARFEMGDQIYEAKYTWEEARQSRWPWNKKGKPGDDPTPDKLKDNWSTPTDRRNMLWARMVSDALRAFCPELVAGYYTEEEAMDMVETVSVTTNDPEKIEAEAKKRRSTKKAKPEEEKKPDPAPAPEPEKVEDADFEFKEKKPVDPPFDDKPIGDITYQSVTHARLASLFDQREVPDASRAKALEKRGAKEINDLSVKDAKEIIAKLEALGPAKN